MSPPVNRWFEDNRWAGDAILAVILLIIAVPAASLSAASERARIARELHDIVAHSLSAIVGPAEGGAAAARA